MFEQATAENTLIVLKQAIANYGKPASIMTDHGAQFYANASTARKKSVSEYEKN